MPPTPTPTPGAADLPQDWLEHRNGISLLHGWLPLTIELAVVAVVLIVIGWRTKRWRLLWVPAAVVVAVLVALAAREYVNDQYAAEAFADALPWLAQRVASGR